MSAEPIAFSRALEPTDVLLSNAAQGDHAAFQALYIDVSSRVFALIRRVLIDVSQSEEVTQEVFLEVWQLASRYDSQMGSATTWILTIAHRRAVDRVRAAQSSALRDTKVGIREHSTVFDHVAETAEIRLEHERAKRALTRVTPLQREALTLAYWEGLTVKEIAAKLDVSLSAVKARLRGGLIRMRDEMEKTTAAEGS